MAFVTPPKSDDKYAQLTRSAFIINDFLWNYNFNNMQGKSLAVLFIQMYVMWIIKQSVCYLAYCLINSSFQAFYCIFVYYVFIFCSKIEIALFTQKAYCRYSHITADILVVYHLDSGIIQFCFDMPVSQKRHCQARLSCRTNPHHLEDFLGN